MIVPNGIVNIGNTCFMNTIIQILCQLPEINGFMETSPDLHSQAVEKPIFDQWIDIWKWIQDPEVPQKIVPRGFLNAFVKVAQQKKQTIFSYGSQCDTIEFLQFFIDCLHECLKRPMNITINGECQTEIDKLAVKCYTSWKEAHENDYSIFKDLFNGISVSSIVSEDGHTTHSHMCEIFFTLDLSVSQGTTKYKSLEECLDVFTEAEVMEGENAWYNDNTKTYENVRKQILFWNLPTVLVFCLKRFSIDGTSKETHPIQFPLTLDMGKYVCGYNRTQHQYELYGICNHFGNVYKGHYTNFVKTIEGNWFHCNDEIIHKIENPAQLQSPHAYCLFYRKKNNDV